jgi:predicted acetyltransferase
VTTFEVRPCSDLGEYGDALMSIGQYFGQEPSPEKEERFSRLLPIERMHAAWEDDRIVGGAGGVPFQMSVPGGTLACAGTTVVGVAPTHRRRGVLRAMMRAHIDDAHARGEPLAALWASEETIYGRFGYGRAAFAGEIAVPKEYVQFTAPNEPAGTIRIVDRDEALQTFPPLWDALARHRPGMFIRSRDWWEIRTLHDPPERRQGAGPKRFALLELEGAPAAYAIYRHKMDWEAGVTVGKISVVEAIGARPDALVELWRYLLDIDWVATIESWLLPPDHPLFFVLAQTRRARYRVGDGLWARLVDVGAALSGRGYPEEGEVVFDVRDAFCPWNEGRWRLAGGTAERTDADADLALDVAALGSAYLGGIRFAQLAQGGQVQELNPGAIERADGIFRHGLHPWCPEIF